MKHLEFYDNCPCCRSGILEPVWTLRFNNGLVKSFDYQGEFNKGDIVVLMCSKDVCGFSILKAAPYTLASTKKAFRDLLFGQIKKGCLPMIDYHK